MSRVSVSGLAFAYPSGEELFANVSFRVSSGTCIGIVGANGVGKSTLLKVLAGELAASEGTVHIDGLALAMAQDVGAREDETVHGLLRTTLPAALARVSQAVADAEQKLAGGDSAAGLALAESIADWSELGGY
jgi:ATPase subunit of ABC transporter with duplicated ATPase domains